MVDVLGYIVGAGGAIVRTVTPYIQPAVRIITQPPIRTIAPIVTQAPRVIGQVAAPVVRQVVRTAAPVMQTIQRSPAMLPAVIGTRIGMAAAPHVARAVQQAPRVLARSPAQVIAPALFHGSQQIGQLAAPAVRQTARMVQGNPAMLPAVIGARIGFAAAPAAARAIQQAPRVLSRSPAQVIAPALFNGAQQIARVAAPTVRQAVRTAAPVMQTIQRSPAMLPAVVGARIGFAAAPALARAAAPAIMRVPGEIVRRAGGVTGGSARVAPSPAPLTIPTNRQQVINAAGATGNAIVRTAEGVGSWWSNRALNMLNVGASAGPVTYPGLGALERGELSAAREFDARNRNFWASNPVARNTYALLMRRDPVTYDTSSNLARAARLFTDTAGSAFVLGVTGGVAGATRYAGDVLGTAARGDYPGAGRKIGEGAVGVAVGVPMWVASAPGRVAADPAHAPFELMGEWYSGKALFGAASRGIRGIGKGLTPIGEATGIVRMKSRGFEHVPLESPAAQVLEVLTAEKSYNVARAVSRPSLGFERVPGQLLPRRHVSIRDPGSLGDVAAGAEGLFVTHGSPHMESYGRYFLTKPRGASGWLLGQRVYVMPEVRNVRVPDLLRSQIGESVRTTGQFRHLYPDVVRLAGEQSRKIGQPVAVPSPKRATGHPQPESELFLVFGDATSQRIAQTQWAGFAPGSLTRVKKLALGTQRLESTRIGNLGENLRYNWDIGRSGTRFYNRNYLRAMSEDMNRKYGELYGDRLMYPGQYGAHGSEHAAAVSGNLDAMRRENPRLQVAASRPDLLSRGTYHDIAKIGDAETEPYPHGFATAEAIRTGLFSTPELRAMEPRARQALARDIELHTRIDPRPYTYRGLRTWAIDRPSITAKALANADRMDLFRLGRQVDQRRLFTIPATVTSGRAGRAWMLNEDALLFPGRRRGRVTNITPPGIRDTIGELRERGRRAGRGYVEKAEAGYFLSPARAALIQPGYLNPLDTRKQLYGRARSRTYGDRQSAAYPARYGRSYGPLAAGGYLMGYGPSKGASGRGYDERYRSNPGYGNGYGRNDYPPTYNLIDLPKYPPAQPPTYPPVRSPPYPPAQPPTYPPSKPPTYPPVRPPTYPPSKPPTYPPVRPPTYPPSKPPTYPPVRPPTYPPTKPPTYPPVRPPTYPPYPPTEPPYQPPIPPYEPPYEPPYPPISPPFNLWDSTEGRQGRTGGNNLAWDFGERLGVYDPARMFGKRTKKDRIFGMSYTRRKRKSKLFLG